jgi:hypothetical protein
VSVGEDDAVPGRKAVTLVILMAGSRHALHLPYQRGPENRIILADTEGHMLVRTGASFGTPLPPLVDERSYRRVLDTGSRSLETTPVST